MAAYKAESRDLKNAKRRAKREDKKRATLDATKHRRLVLRKRGAVARLERRILAATNDATRAALVGSHNKAVAAVRVAVAAAVA